MAIKKIKQREEYEESTFTRTILTKKQKKLEQKLAMGQYIDPEVEGEEIMRLLNDEVLIYCDQKIFKWFIGWQRYGCKETAEGKIVNCECN